LGKYPFLNVRLALLSRTLVIKQDDVYKIQSVLKKRRKGRRVQYLVKWLGYPESFNSWIFKQDLQKRGVAGPGCCSENSPWNCYWVRSDKTCLDLMVGLGNKYPKQLLVQNGICVEERSDSDCLAIFCLSHVSWAKRCFLWRHVWNWWNILYFYDGYL
jgi:hypothetical protein